MAWDEDYPYLPTKDDGRPSCDARGANPTKRDIRLIYEERGHEVMGSGDHPVTFIPFKEVRMRLRPTHIWQGRSACGMLWVDVDSGNGFYMFSGTWGDFTSAHDSYAVPVDGYWSAEKRGRNYGVRLVRLADE